jgi:hypothetical protein
VKHLKKQGRASGICFFLIAASLCLIPSRLVSANGQAQDELLVKAAFVFNFAQFVDWPADTFSSSDSPIIIGIIGSDPLAEAVAQSIQGKTAKGRPFSVRKQGLEASVRQCHIVVVTFRETSRLGKLTELLQGAPVLTVGESAGFAEHGGVINLVLEGGRIKMEVNVTAANSARLTVSSRLLSLAKIIK